MSNQSIRISLLILFILLLLSPLLFRSLNQEADQPIISEKPLLQIKAVIDARDVTRGLYQCQLQIPAEPGELLLWYPKWIPGIHAPRGAIQNLAGLIIQDNHGRRLEWQRDPSDVCRFRVMVSNDASAITVNFDYICNQPSTNSIGVDSYGDAVHAVLSWNNVMMYPEIHRHDQIIISPEIILPEDWQAYCSLAGKRQSGELNALHFDSVTLQRLVDNPLICGKYHVSHQLNNDGKPVYLDIVGSEAEAIQFPEQPLNGMKHMVTEARLLFGHEHYDQYRFLLVCSDQFPHLGLEHLSSSLNGVHARDLINGAGGATRVMSHEYAHSWCGKYRRPMGMYTPNYHDSKDSTLLWVYEGLTQYLGNVLAVRSGLRSQEDFKEMIHYYTSRLRRVNGRYWRSLADTATSSYLLRGGSRNWANWVRGQDYYIEGALIWLEVDCIIRKKSNGTKSLDDFCKVFFAPVEGHTTVAPYSYHDLVQTLQSVQSHNWHELFQKRVYKTQEEFDLTILHASGWEMAISDRPDAEGSDIFYHYRTAYESIGAGFNNNGRIYRVLKGSPAYEAGLARGMRVHSINGKNFNPAVLHQLLIDAKDGKPLKLKVSHNDETYDLDLNYAGGPRYLTLKPLPDQTDYLRAIGTALRPQAENTP